jgi:hypothetical protein
MLNPLFLIVRKSRKPVYELAKEVGVSRNRIGQLIADDDMPRNVQLNTLDRIAAGVGYRVNVEFVPIGNGDENRS